jgi:hypoxanthine-guanine phosphoribosyltransferase
MITKNNEHLLRVKFQEAAQSENAPVVIKNLLKKAEERDMLLLDYITETGPEIREIFDRMLAAAAEQRREEKNQTTQ